MRITITCPSCQQRSQIESQHRGRRLKCPYPACKQPFIVGDDGVARHPEQQATAAPIPSAPPVAAAPQEVDWQAPPAPRNTAAEPMSAEPASWEAPPIRREATGFEPPPVRHGVEEPSWEPPPVRRPGYEEQEVAPAEEMQVTVAAEEPASTSDYSMYAPPRKKRGGLVIIIGAGIVFVVSAVLIVFFLKQLQAGEGRLHDTALKMYKDGKYRQSQDAFKQLSETYSSSDKKPVYLFMVDLSSLRDSTSGTISDVPKVNAIAAAFHKEQKGKPLFKEYHEDIWDSFAALAAAAADRARNDADPELLNMAKECIERAKQEGLTIRDTAKVDQRHAELDKKLVQATTAVEMAAARKQILDAIASVMEKKQPGSAETVLKLHDEALKKHPKLGEDAELKQRLAALQREEPEWVTFTAEAAPKLLPRGPAPGASTSPSIIIGPGLKGTPTPVENSPVVLALDRGVLYGLSQADGAPRWAMRVGIDTHSLPVRLRAGPAQPELALVLSAETNTVSAVETATGKTQWHYQLGSACSAGPVLVGRPPTAYLPTEDGKIYVIEPLGGRLLGVYETGQPLTVPGSFDPITQRLFIPAAHRRIHVLDLQAKKCAGVIYTGHAVGGLRGAPIIAPPTPGQPAVVLIAEAETLDSMKLRAFSVPDTVSDAQPVQGADGKPIEFTVPGWSWFAPYFDGDTIGLATDRGYLALFGLKRGTNDRQVFRVSTQPLPIGEQANPLTASQRPIGRALIADVLLGQWWLLVGGQLQPHRFDLYRQQLRPSGEALSLGIPLQEAQSSPNGQQLVLVTQALDRAEGIDRSLATSLTTSTGKLNWQRQVGFIAGQEPLVLGDRVFAVDKLGGFLSLDLKKLSPEPNQQVLTNIDWLANGAEESAVAKLVAAPDGKSVVAITFYATSERLRVQRYDLEKGLLPEQMYRLDSAPVGTPALTETAIMVPCRDGTLREFPLAGARELPVPLTWRDLKAGSAVGHAALLTPTQLLISNGLNRLQEWNRVGNVWQKGDDSLELSTGKIVTPLLILPAADDKYLCLGDDANILHLFSASRLAPLREWRLDGKITKGPFVKGKHIGCVVDGQRLLWIDPEQDAPLWQYPAPGAGLEAGIIVGEPALADNMVVVAHQSGSYSWLDPESGAVKGQATVRNQAIPITGAVPFGPGRVLSPLSDGTFMILSPSGG